MALIPYLPFDPLRLIDRGLLSDDQLHNVCPFQQRPRRGLTTPDVSSRTWENVLRPWNDLIRPMAELTATLNRLGLNELSSNITSNEEKFQVNIDVQHFAPEELSVKVVNREVIIEGKHEEKRDEHGYVSRHFVRRYTLPEGCLQDTVESSLSSDGVLTVTAPKVLVLPSTGERIVPISQTGPVKKRTGGPDPIKDEQ